MIKLILSLAFTGILSAQTVVTPASITFSADATVAIQTWFTTQVLSTPTTLALPMTAGALTMTVTDASQLAINQEFYIGTEAVNPSAIVGNVVTVTRADIGTTAAAHPAGASVGILKYKSLKNWCKQALAQEVAAIMSQITSPTGATQDAAIATANAAKAAAVAGAIQ